MARETKIGLVVAFSFLLIAASVVGYKWFFSEGNSVGLAVEAPTAPPTPEPPASAPSSRPIASPSPAPIARAGGPVLGGSQSVSAGQVNQPDPPATATTAATSPRGEPPIAAPRGWRMGVQEQVWSKLQEMPVSSGEPPPPAPPMPGGSGAAPRVAVAMGPTERPPIAPPPPPTAGTYEGNPSPPAPPAPPAPPSPPDPPRSPSSPAPATGTRPGDRKPAVIVIPAASETRPADSGNQPVPPDPPRPTPVRSEGVPIVMPSPAPKETIAPTAPRPPAPREGIPVTIRPQPPEEPRPIVPNVGAPIVEQGGVVPNIPVPGVRGVVVEEFDVEHRVARVGDNYANLSQAKYQTEKYQQALAMFNRERDPRLIDPIPGQPVYLPEARYLEARFRSAIPGLAAGEAPAPAGAGTSGVPQPRFEVSRPDPATVLGPPVNRLVPVPVNDPARQTAKAPWARTGKEKQYRVGPNETIWAVAKRTLGTGERWPEIAALNKDRLQDVSNQLPAGLVLLLPPDAKVAQAAQAAQVDGPETPQ